MKLTLAFLAAALSPALFSKPNTPLAQDYVLVAKSPDPLKVPLYSPAIITLPSHRLVASYMQAHVSGGKDPEYQVMLTSDDGGATWFAGKRAPRCRAGFSWPESPFTIFAPAPASLFSGPTTRVSPGRRHPRSRP